METVTLPLAVAAGVVAFLSPCFLPIVPVFLTYLVGGPQAGARGRGPQVALHAGAFIAGFTVVFVGLWASIGLVGYLLGDHQDLLRILGGAILVVLGLHVAGLIDIPALHRRVGPAGPVGPSSRRGSTAVGAGGQGEAAPSLGRSTLMGLAFGAGWTPCIGPILGGVLGLATTSETVGQGTVLLVAFSLGLGIPFLLVALGATALSRKLTWLLRHQTALALLNGAMLILIGFLMITNLFGKLAGLIPALGL